MEDKTIKVKVKEVTLSAQKLRLVVDLIRGKKVEEALDILKFLNKKGAKIVSKAVQSGIANAQDRFSWEPEDLYVSAISADKAKTQKWRRYNSRGRVSRILKRKAHLNLELTHKK